MAGQLYREIGLKIARKDFDVWSSRVMVPNSEKALLSVSLIFSLLWRRSVWGYHVAHDDRLHSALSDLPSTHTASVVTA